MRDKILKHFFGLKTTVGKKRYLTSQCFTLRADYLEMCRLRHYPNPIYKDKPVTHDRVEELYLDLCHLEEILEALEQLPLVEA